MSLDTWSTREPLREDFRRAWDERLAHMPLANFSMRLDWLAWEASQGRHATAALAEERGRRGALVLREVGAEAHCGWPWRWQAAVEAAVGPEGPGLSRDDAAWLAAQAARAAGAARVRCFLPASPRRGVPAYVAGRVILQAIDRTDDELFQGMHPNKRRLVRRSRREGVEVHEPNSLDEYAAFQRLCDEIHRARSDGPADGHPPPGVGYREWELPWMWLLLACHRGRLEAAVGDGLCPGGVADGRAALATDAARRVGAMALLVHEEAKRLRDRGHRWLNHGGDTVFKREIAGTLGHPLTVWCWLGGGARWSVSNRIEWLVGRVRPAFSRLSFRLRERLRRATSSTSAFVLAPLHAVGLLQDVESLTAIAGLVGLLATS